MSYSKGIIAIPAVTGDIEIIITTEGTAVNLFDSSTASYDMRIKGAGWLELAYGLVTTAPIDITDISTLTVSGITEVYFTNLAYYACSCTYSDSAGTTKVNLVTYPSATYVFDVAAMKASYPTGKYIRLSFALKNNVSVSSADTTNLTIYGS